MEGWRFCRYLLNDQQLKIISGRFDSPQNSWPCLQQNGEKFFTVLLNRLSANTFPVVITCSCRRA
jgi:hypothetical protein